MHELKQHLRSAVLYISTVVLISGVPMAAFADKSQACADAGQKNSNMVTDPATGQCVKKSSLKKATTPTDSSTPAPTTTETPTPSPESTTDPALSDSAISNSGSGSVDANSNTNASSNTTDNNATKVDNTVKGTSNSGNAGVIGNESAGNAGSGNSNADATVINSVHSTVDGDTGVAHFTADVNGDVIGDITLGTNGSGPINASNSTTLNGNTTINNSTELNNDISLDAKSGKATVKGNESTGSATSGSANAVANILNLINTIIAANQSFVGTINIYGNLNGDILMSPEFIPQLLASNANSTYNSNSNLALSTNINDDASIINNVKLNATSGNASVTGNKTSGSATTGTGDTNLTILNLTGHTVNAANSLLVFVNVLGKWVGLIVDAPGATAAAFGSNVVSDTVDVSGNTNINNASKITNNVDVNAQSGNANVIGNKSAGDASSGNATASANIANISTSTFNLTGWFGVLYINVFGQWLGSFGVDTEAGTVTPVGGMAVADKAATIGAPNMHFGFVPKIDPTANLTDSSLSGADVAATNDAAYQGAVLASAIRNGQNLSTNTEPTLKPIASPRQDPFSVIMMITGFTIAGGAGIVWLFRRWF